MDSEQLEEPKHPAPAWGPDVPYYYYPPFPSTDGKNVILFKDFKPSGIQISFDEDEDEELDGLGIPTVTLRVTHELDKDKKKKKKKRAAGGGLEELPAAPQVWYEEWEEGEVLRKASQFDPMSDRIDRLYQIQRDFKTARRFPISVRTLYDEFRLYLGLIDSTQPRPRKKFLEDEPTPAVPEADEEGDVADDVSDDVEVGPRIDPDDTTTHFNNLPPPVGEEEEGKEHSPFDLAIEAKEDRMDAFFHNPEKSMKIFLSSHFRDRGLMWLEFNLLAGPIIVRFFLNFIIRHRALPEYERGLKRAVTVAELAEKELPKTKQVATSLPDDWGKSCLDLWGPRITPSWGVPGFRWEQADESDGANIVEIDPTVPVAELVDADVAPELVPEPTVAEILNDAIDLNINGQEHAFAAVKDEKDAEGSDPTEQAPSPWDNAPQVNNGGENNSWGDDDWNSEYNASPNWEPPEPTPNCFTFVGPASFPNTHAPVRAEQSVREIISFAPPRDRATSTAASPVTHLHANLATVVLGPWKKTKENSEIPPPRMIQDDATKFGIGSVHDPTKGNITVFVAPSAIEGMIPGLGIGGLFVQVSMKPTETPAPRDKKPNKHRGKGGSSKPRGFVDDGRRWWYIESTNQVIPSFWTQFDD